MKKLGHFTGKLYDSEVKLSDIGECCFVLNWKEPILENEPLVEAKRKELKERCRGCLGCSESIKAFEHSKT